ncbi:Low-density lipoprotein receptor-related protein 6-like 1, partial [Homarus americanus]
MNKRIESIAADGSDRRLMVRTTGQPISLMVTGAQIAWALEDSSLLFIASKVNMTNIVNITLANKISSFPSVFRLSELAWKIPPTMATSRNACSDNGNCSQLCLGNVKNDQVCGCGPGFTLSHDGVSCRPNGCAPHLFMCTTTHTCIPAKWRQ